MSAGLGALGDDPVRAGALHQPGQRHRSHHRKYLGAGLLPARDEACRIPRAGGDHRHPLLRCDIRHLLRLWVHQHDIHAKGTVRQGPAPAYALPKARCIHAASADESQGAGVGDGGGKFGGGNIGHTALNNGEFRTQQLIESRHRLFSLLTIPAARRPR